MRDESCRGVALMLATAGADAVLRLHASRAFSRAPVADGYGSVEERLPAAVDAQNALRAAFT